MAAETRHLLSHLRGPCRRCCIFRTRFLPPTCSPEPPFGFLTSCFSRWRLSGSPGSAAGRAGVGVQGWMAKGGSAPDGGVTPSAERAGAMPGGGWYREPVWLMPGADAAAVVHGGGSSQGTSLSPCRGASGSQGCSKGSEPLMLQCAGNSVPHCGSRAVPGCATLCQTAPHCAVAIPTSHRLRQHDAPQHHPAPRCVAPCRPCHAGLHHAVCAALTCQRSIAP